MTVPAIKEFWKNTESAVLALYVPKFPQFQTVIFLGRALAPQETGGVDKSHTLLVELYANYMNLWSDPRLVGGMVGRSCPIENILEHVPLDFDRLGSMRSQSFDSPPSQLEVRQGMGRLFRLEVRQALRYFTENIYRFHSVNL